MFKARTAELVLVTPNGRLVGSLPACQPCPLQRPGGKKLNQLSGRHVTTTALMSLSCDCSMPN